MAGRDLDNADTSVARTAANEGLTAAKFAEEMSLTEEQVWEFLNQRGRELLLEKFEANGRRAGGE